MGVVVKPPCAYDPGKVPLMSRRTIAAAVLALVLSAPTATRACPSCRDSIPNSDAQQASALPGGFNLSIYYMLGSVGLVGGLVVRMVVREARATDASR
jgi:hypothetical protein